MASRHTQRESVLGWMASERLYEEYLFFYVLILVFWAATGFFTFGFEIAGYSPAENLLANFLLFIALAVAMAFTPVWYRLIFGTQARLQRRTDEIYAQVENIEDEEKRRAILQHLEQDGALPPRRLQKWCLIGLAWFALFEIFFVSAWVKDLQLVWQPEWVNKIIAWAHENTSLPPNHREWKLFHLTIRFDNILSTQFKTEGDFLASEMGKVVVLFHVWRALIFFPTLFMLYMLIGKAIDWLGMNQFRYFRVGRYWDHDRFSRFVLYSVFFIPIFALGGFFLLFMDLKFTSAMSFNKYSWLGEFQYNFIFVFMIIGFKFIYTWLLFWKDIAVNLYQRKR